MTRDPDYQFCRSLYSANGGCVYLHRRGSVEPTLFCSVRADEPIRPASGSDIAKALHVSIMLNALSDLSLRDKLMRETGVTPQLLDAMFEVAAYRERAREIMK